MTLNEKLLRERLRSDLQYMSHPVPGSKLKKWVGWGVLLLIVLVVAWVFGRQI